MKGLVAPPKKIQPGTERRENGSPFLVGEAPKKKEEAAGAGCEGSSSVARLLRTPFYKVSLAAPLFLTAKTGSCN